MPRFTPEEIEKRIAEIEFKPQQTTACRKKNGYSRWSVPDRRTNCMGCKQTLSMRRTPMPSATAFTPGMSSGSQLTGLRRSVDQPPIPIPTAKKPPSSRRTAETVEHEEMERRAIACCDQALADVGLAGVAVLRQVRHDYFAGATTTTMARYHRSAHDVPSDLNPARRADRVTGSIRRRYQRGQRAEGVGGDRRCGGSALHGIGTVTAL
jgi:hypothetical protein